MSVVGGPHSAGLCWLGPGASFCRDPSADVRSFYSPDLAREYGISRETVYSYLRIEAVAG